MSNEEDEESCLTRQCNEAAVLKSIYGDQLAFLSELHQPLECIIHLWGRNSDDDPLNIPRFDLHIKCSEEYPLTIPSIFLENYKKISNNRIATLREELLNLANSNAGEVHIHELAQYCENFLFRYDSPKSVSLYDGMMQRNKDLEESRAKELQKRMEDEERKKEEMIGHIESQKQAVKKALRRKSKSENADQEEQAHRDRDKSSKSPDRTATPQDQVGRRDSPRDFDPVSDLPPWDLLAKSRGPSRFLNDFQVIEELGKGAYGEVVKVRNNFDGRFYAIKKIELDPRMKQLNRTRVIIDREVKLLSRLDHENVVRYITSWVERVHIDKSESQDTLDGADSTPKGLNQDVLEMLPCVQESIDWNDARKRDQNDDSDDFIEFGSASGEVIESESSSVSSEKSNQTLKPLLYVFIQMELCEKSTLRIAIDNGLYHNVDRGWRLFREIVEGLNYIHHQRVMHRDLKPVNIFLDNNDQVKIGDFGLATTSKAQKSNVSSNPSAPASVDTTDTSESSLKDYSSTGPVGTALYVAPELDGDKRRDDCNQKVDIYSLGIIFFEMVHAPFNTLMERYHTISNLRKPEIIFPPDFAYVEKTNERKMIKWMLTHDIKARPSAHNLLSHESLLTVKLDEGEVKDMVKRTLSNPQSKDYKFLIASCLNQEMPATFEATYNMSTFRSFRFTSSLNLVMELLRPIFHHYGAVSFSPPLFTPGQALSPGVTLMTQAGGVVHVTCDLQMPFARYVVQNPSVMTFKRYAMDKSFEEMPVGIHPREVYECCFDIVSSSWGDLMPEVEVFAVVKDILKAFPQFLRRNCSIYLNHSALISTLIEICVANSSTAADKTETRDAIIKAMTESSPKIDLKSLTLPESALNVISSWVEMEGDAKNIIASLSDLVRAEEQLSTCRRAVDLLQKVITECSALEMPCPVVIKPSLVRNPSHFTGVLFQVKCEPKVKTKSSEHCIIMSGGRYDGLLEELRRKIPSKDVSKPVRCITGFTMNLETLVSSIDDNGGPSVVDVLFCSLGSFRRTADRTSLLRELWALNLRIYFSSTLQTMEEIQSLCEQLGVTVLLLFKANEPGLVRVRCLNKESKSNEKKLSSGEVVDYLSKLFKQETTVSSSRPVVNVPIIHFISTEKITMGNMKIHETQVHEHLSTVIQRFSPSVRINVLAVQVKEREFIKVIASLIELEDVVKSLDQACKRYPMFKKLIQKLSKQIEDLRTLPDPTAVIILYSLYDNGYKVIM